MRTLLAAVAALAFALPGFAAEGLAKGTPEIKSVSALAFGPNGVLFIGDKTAAAIHAIDTGDTKEAGKDDVKVEKIDEKAASAMGTTADKILISDVKTNPASGNIYLAVTRQGAGGGSMILKLTRDGKLAEFATKDVMFATGKLTGADDKSQQTSITSLAYVGGKVMVAGLSNEQFASTLRVIPFPFQTPGKGTNVEIYHGAHGAVETKSPIQTFTPIKISGADYLLAAYTCTPLVRLPISDLKPGEKVRGTTIAELGNGNKPLDMIVYTKDKKEYLLIANSKHGVIKLSTDGMLTAAGIDKKVSGKAGVGYETIKELTGVVRLDKMDAERALILVKAEDKSFSLKSVPLP